MKSSLIKLFIGMAALAITWQTNAAVALSLEPSSRSVDLGSSASLDLVISGLGEQTSPSLGGFAIELSYDPAIISTTSLLFGNHLDLGVFGSVQFSDLSTPGVIQFDEVSLESASDLIVGQPGSFKLATLGFTGIGSGLSTISFSTASLSDETGELSLPFTSSAAQIQVIGPVQVPDQGSTATLLLLGIFCVCYPGFSVSHLGRVGQRPGSGCSRQNRRCPGPDHANGGRSVGSG